MGEYPPALFYGKRTCLSLFPRMLIVRSTRNTINQYNLLLLFFTNIMEFHCFSKISVYHHKQIKFNTKFLSISRATLPLSNKNDGAVVGRKVHLPSLPPHKKMKFITISFLARGSNSINPFNIEADSSSVVFR